MGCNCGKHKVTSQPKKIVKTKARPLNRQTSTLKRIIRRTAY